MRKHTAQSKYPIVVVVVDVDVRLRQCVNRMLKAMQGEKFKMRKLKRRRKTRTNQFLSNLTAFIFEFYFAFFSVSLLCDWVSARAHAFAHGHWLNARCVFETWNWVFLRYVSHFEQNYLFFFGGIRKRNERCGFSTEVKHDELFDWIYLFRAKSIYADFFLGELP